MSKLAMALGVALVVIGLVIALAPDRLLSLMDWESPRGQYTNGLVRAGIGLVLVLAAAASRFPLAFRIFGFIAIVGGLGSLLVPADDWVHVVLWGTQEQLTLYRLSGAFGAIPAGVFIAYAARRPATRTSSLANGGT